MLVLPAERVSASPLLPAELEMVAIRVLEEAQTAFVVTSTVPPSE
jgi:hypothetical protein